MSLGVINEKWSTVQSKSGKSVKKWTTVQYESSSPLTYRYDCIFHIQSTKASVSWQADEHRAKRVKRSRKARTEIVSEKFGRNARARSVQSTFDLYLACVKGIFDHVFSKPLTSITDKFDYTFSLREIKKAQEKWESSISSASKVLKGQFQNQDFKQKRYKYLLHSSEIWTS